MRALTCLALLALGALVGVSAVWTHNRWWALALGAAATLVLEMALPRGLLRIAFAAGWVCASGYFVFARGEGDFVVGSDPAGYTFLALGLVVLVLGLATLPPRERTRTPPGAEDGTRGWSERIGSRA